ncbi:hypothetical protein C8R44DRAFT_332049 [Mycena epipterygia]|nr:hypothetical protein C8R44DRAFT_332049 [Mycena epipterygia]
MRRGSARVQRRLEKGWRAAGVGRYGRRMAVDKRRRRPFFACTGFPHLGFDPSRILSGSARILDAAFPEDPRVTGCGGIVRCDVIFALLFGVGEFGMNYRVFLVRYRDARGPGFRAALIAESALDAFAHKVCATSSLPRPSRDRACRSDKCILRSNITPSASIAQSCFRGVQLVALSSIPILPHFPPQPNSSLPHHAPLCGAKRLSLRIRLAG